MTDNMETVSPGLLTEQERVPAHTADHAMGIELQIVELVEQQARARAQHREHDAEGFERELVQLRGELAANSDFAPSERSVSFR